MLGFVWGLISGGFSAVLGVLRGLPPKVLATLIGAVVLLVTYLVWAHHERAIGEARAQAAVKVWQDKAVALQDQLTGAQGANDACASTIALLQDKLNECTSGREADQMHQAAVNAGYNDSIAALQRTISANKAGTRALNDGACAQWAALPACGVRVRP